MAPWTQPPQPALMAGSRGLQGVPARRGRLARVPRGKSQAAVPDRVATPPFPKQVPPFRTPPPRLQSSRKRPIQSLSWLIEAGIGLAAPQAEPAASRAQEGLPESPDLARLPLPAPYCCSCWAPGPALLTPLLSHPALWPKQHLMPSPSPSPAPQMPTLLIPGAGGGPNPTHTSGFIKARSPGLGRGLISRTRVLGWVALGKSPSLSEPHFPR